jgi:hypothetical protein
MDSQDQPHTPPHRQVRQRDALGKLLYLSRECGTLERKLEDDRADVLRRNTRQWQAAKKSIDDRHAKKRTVAQGRAKEALAKLDESRDAKLDALDKEANAQKVRVRETFRRQKKAFDAQLQDAKWLAEGVRDADHNRATDAHKSAHEAGDKDAKQLDQEERDAAAVTINFGRQPAEPAIDLPAADWPDARQQVDAAIERLHGLRLPKLTVGALPFVLLMLTALTAGAATHFLQFDDPAVAVKTMPDWPLVGGVAGGAAALALILGLLLRRRNNRVVDQSAQQFADAVATARAAIAKRRDDADAIKIEKLKIADANYKKEQASIDAKFGPQLAKLDQDFRVADRAQADKSAAIRQVAADEAAAIWAAEDAKWREKLEEIAAAHRAELQPHIDQRDQTKATAEAAYAAGRQGLEADWDGALAITREMADDDRPEDAAIGDWRKWRPPETFAPTVRLGTLHVDMEKQGGETGHHLPLPLPYDVPALLAFPDAANLLLRHEPAGRDAAVDSLRLAMLRLLTSLPPGRVRFTMIDPIGLGRSFAGFMHLADYDEDIVGGRVLTEADAIEQKLADLTQHMETVIQKYLRNEFETIDDYNRQAGELAEPYRFVVIADLPTNFSEEAIKRLASIADSGARCGVHLLAALDTRQTPAAGGTQLDDLAHNCIVLDHDAEGNQFRWDDEVYRSFPLKLDAPPDDAALTDVLRVVGEAAKQAARVEVPFTGIVPRNGQMWSKDSARDLAVPVGRTGATRLQEFRLGKGVAQHALIAGKTGSGKSTLLNGLITNLALWYPPSQVEMYLIDFKRGVEFKAYATHRLPHVRAVAVESDREFGASVLGRLDEELARRGEVFRKAGVQDVAGFRKAQPDVPMPRIVLIVDEFQELFTEDDKLSQDSALLIDRLVRQGRAFGMHVVLGSQTIGGAAGLARSTLGQIAVRVALQCNENDSRLILGETNTAARLLGRPGEAILNDAGGQVEANSPFQVAWLPDEERADLLRRVEAKAKETGQTTEKPVVFEGNAPADLADNDELIAAKAGKPPRQNVAYLGEPVAIKAPTHVPFTRRAGANLLIVGQQDEAAAALAASTILSLVATAPRPPRFVILDGTPADDPTAGTLRRAVEEADADADFADYRAAPDALADLAADLQTRLDGDDDATPIYLVIHHLQRFRDLKREDAFSAPAPTGGGFGSMLGGGDDNAPAVPTLSPSAALTQLLRDGPPAGVHAIATIDTVNNIERRLSRDDVREFDWRVLFQMAANDSTTLIDTPAANRLGFHRALLASEEQGTQEKFRPYAAR